MTALPVSRMPGVERSRPDEDPLLSRSSSGHVHRVTVNLTEHCASELQKLSDTTGYTKTDVVNRAIAIYNYLEEIQRNGGAIFVRENPDDDLDRLTLL
jgi:hypothetical protein